MSSDKLFVVAIDFGTTYSGYAFSNIHRKDEILTYNWIEGISQAPKTPTSILFSPLKRFAAFGYEAEERYAALSQQGLHKDWYFFKRFKLTLYKNKNLNKNTTIRDYTGKELPAIQVFSGGIKFLKDHLFRNFQERVPQLQDGDIHWVLTVPAIWDEAAKKFMRKSAEQAGIPGTQLTLALEPESAALYCQSGTHLSGLEPMNPGDKFLLLDCGGGTVDITAHEVRSDKSLKEIHRATGGPWGGIKVDDAFQEYLLELFGFETFTSLAKNEVIELERSFESFKRKVGTGNTVYYMQIPLSLRQSAPAGTLVASKLKLQSEKVKEFFDKPIETICTRIQKMISAMPLYELKTILLVGGFSESKLLQEGIQRHFPSIAVCTPSGPSTAVVKGAVDFGHCPEKIRFRMSPYTYGIKTTIPFRHGIHPERKLFILQGTERCRDIFDVHVKINQLVETGTPISDKTYVPLYPGQSTMSIRVVTSTSRKPGFVTDAHNRTIGRFKVKLPDCEFKGQKAVNVKMIFSGTELKVEARDNITNQLYTTSFRFE